MNSDPINVKSNQYGFRLYLLKRRRIKIKRGGVKSNQYGFRLGTKDNCIILNERYKLNLTNMDLDVTNSFWYDFNLLCS